MTDPKSKARRLAEIAAEALKRAEGKPLRALTAFRNTVLTDAGLLAELIGPELIRERAEAYLRDLDANVQPGDGASQVEVASQRSSDRPAPISQDSSRLSHKRPESQHPGDQPAAPSTRDDAASHSYGEGQYKPDRRVAPATRMSRSVAEQVARRSFYDTRLGCGITFRHATLYDIINEERKGAKYTRLMTLLRTRKTWPEDAEVPQVYSEEELEALSREALDSLPAVPLEALTHG